MGTTQTGRRGVVTYRCGSTSRTTSPCTRGAHLTTHAAGIRPSPNPRAAPARQPLSPPATRPAGDAPDSTATRYRVYREVGAVSPPGAATAEVRPANDPTAPRFDSDRARSPSRFRASTRA